MIEVWALKHAATGKWMPCRMYRTARAGWSFWDPYDERPGYAAFDPSPRVFFSRQSALNAKSAWEAGVWEKRETRGSYFDPPESLPPAPSPASRPRQKGDLVLVRGELRL